MKKLTLFLSLLLTVFITATAEIDTSKEYLIQDVTSGKFLNAANNDAHATGPIGGVNFVNYAGTNSQILTFEASGNGYKLKFKTGKYVYCQQWNVDARDDSTVLTFIDNGDGTYYIQKSSTSTYFKSQEVDGTYYPFCDAAASARTKVKLIEVPDPAPVAAPVQEVTSGIYEIQNQDTQGSRGYLVHSTSYANKIKLAESKYPDMTSTTFCFQSRTESGVTPYWYVYNSEAGNTYIFSLATGQFINDTSDNNAVALTTTPQPVKIQNVSGTIFNIKSTIRDTYTLTAAVGWEQSGDNVRWHDAATDGGYPFHFIYVSTIIDAGIITVDQDIINNAIEAIKNAEAVPEEEDRSETLTPDFCPVDGEGVKVNAFNGTFGEEQYGYYHKWESEKTVKEWDHTGSVSSFTDVPMVTIEALKNTHKQDSYILQYPSNNKNITTFTLSNVLSFMKLTAGYGYHIVGYTFSYTTTTAIEDIGGYEGEITCDAAGTHTVDVRGLDAKTVEIAFGNATGETISIYDFYVFVKKGESLTTEVLTYYTTEAPLMAFYKAYTIASKGKPNNHLYAPEGKNMLDICGQGCHNNSSVTVTATDPYQQFMLIPISAIGSVQTDYENCFFLYNVGQRMFVSKEGNFTLLTKYPRNAVEITPGEGEYEGYFRLNFNKTNLLNVSPDSCKNENSSCVITSYNTIDDGNNFYIREVRNFREEDGNEYGVIMDKVFHIEDETKVSEMTAKLNELLQHNGVGYPISTVLRENLETIRDNINYPSSFFDFEYHTNAYKTTTEVNMPVSGNAYRIYARYANGDKRYLYRTEGGKLRMSDANEEPTGYAGTFILKSVSEAADGQGTYLFAHDSGEYMVYVADGKNGVGGSTTGFVSAYEQGDHDADITLITAANKTANQGGVANAAGDFFGGFLLQARNTSSNGNFYLMGGNDTNENNINLHSAGASDIYYSDTRSSIFYVEEASYPNTVKMQKPGDGEDQNTYASIWLPFTVEIPTGMKAYAARVDEANNQLLLYDVGECLPAECGAILIGSEAKSLNLAPAVTKPEPVLNNALKGSREAKTPTEGMVTYVLNGKNKIGFYPYTKTLGAYKAYIELSSVAAAQGLRFAFGPATDIESVITEGEQDAKVYYELSGRRVENPTKGLYIVNGKKMYIK